MGIFGGIVCRSFNLDLIEGFLFRTFTRNFFKSGGEMA